MFENDLMRVKDTLNESPDVLLSRTGRSQTMLYYQAPQLATVDHRLT